MEKKIILLLTGTINSSEISQMKRVDQDVRLNDYITALNKWIKSDIKNIVLVENSNFPKEIIFDKTINSKKIEYLTYDGQNFSRKLGKGFGEINSMEYAFKHSENLKDADYVIKCNGRYFVKEYSKLIEFIENNNFDIIGNFNKSLSYIDSRFFAFKPKFFKDFFIKFKNIINDDKGFFFEHALGKSAHEFLSQDGLWSSLPIPMIIEGVSGTDNIKLNTPIRILKSKIRFYMQYFVHD